jgi:hypothetical protein
MGRVFIAERADLGAELDRLEPVGHVDAGGVCSFFKDEFQELHEATGQLIAPQANSFFSGEDLSELERLLAGTFERVVCQPAEWDQEVGAGPDGEPTYERTSRNAVVAFLRMLAGAARMARERNLGLLIVGD